MDVFSKPPWNDEWTNETAIEWLAETVHSPSFLGYVAVDESWDNPIIAAILGRSRSWWKGKEFNIDEFFVRTDLQGRGIGTKLLEFAEQDLGSRGIHKVVLLSSLHAPAFEFYRKRGYQENSHLRLLYRYK